MRVLVTGANGHIGSNLVRELIQREHCVVAFVRENSNLEGLEGLEVEKKIGDIRDAESVLAAATGCEAIINLAAVYSWGGTVEEIVEPAVQGIQNVLAAASSLGIKRVIHTSSSVAVGISTEPTVRDASHWNEQTRMPYITAKTQSERIAWARAEELGIPLIVINPTAIIGRHDYKITPSTRIIRDYAHGLGSVFKGGFNYVDVRDVAFIHAEALTRGQPGERYIVCGPNIIPKELAEVVSGRTNSFAIPLFLPRWMMIPLTGIMEKILGPNGPYKRSLTEEFYHRWTWFDASKTEQAFGWTPRSLDTMVDDCLSWLAHRELLKPKVAKLVLERIGPSTFP